MGIVVHPGEVLARRTVTDETGVVHHYDEVLAGEAMERGPVMLSWADVDSAGKTAEQGYNVVIHEFIHKIDMRDGAPDGCPPLPSAQRPAGLAGRGQAESRRFAEKVIIADGSAASRPRLDSYGATSIDEFSLWPAKRTSSTVSGSTRSSRAYCRRCWTVFSVPNVAAAS